MSQEWSPAQGDRVEVTVRGRVRRLAAAGKAALVDLDDGTRRWIPMPETQQLLTATTWRRLDDPGRP